MNQLLEQSKNYPGVEIIGLFDNKKRSIGEKRQDLLNLAKGQYLVFIDDDDRISDDYISSVIQAMNENPNTDCIVFDCICCIENSSLKKLCKYGVEFEYGDINNGTEWRGKPAHTMVYKSSIAKSHIFSNIRNGEDMDWVKRAWVDIKIQTRIDKILYYYDANYKTTSETAGLNDEVIKENVLKLIQQNTSV
jgi:glycosyltransferase involved in cell wall biosynthesis